MKDLVILAREQPLAFVMFIFFTMAIGGGGVFTSGAFSQDETLKKSQEYTDSQVDGVRRDMNKGFDSVNCTLIQMQKESTQTELYGLEERETTEPNADRRRRIKQLNDKVKTLSDKLGSCK